MNIKKIFDHNRNWANEKLGIDPEYFENLSKGQNPQILYIGCSDSRVNATDLLGVEPGEAFIHRNIANMVINTDLSAMSVINYAVSILKVQHVIVCGHYGCGGVKAAMEPKDMGILNPWLPATTEPEHPLPWGLGGPKGPGFPKFQDLPDHRVWPEYGQNPDLCRRHLPPDKGYSVLPQNGSPSGHP